MNRIAIASIVMVVVGVTWAGVKHSGESENPFNMDSTTVAVKSAVLRDEGMGATSVRSPGISLTKNKHSNVSLLELVAIKSDGGRTSYYVCLQTLRAKGEDWALWETASDASGNKFTMAKLREDVEGGITLRANVAARLDRKYFNDATESGLKWRLICKSGEDKVTIPPQYIAGFLKRVDKEFGGK